MMNKAFGLLFGATSVALCFAACGGDDEPQAECTFNDECVGDRICTNGMCVDPTKTGTESDMGNTPLDMTPPHDMGANPPDQSVSQPDLAIDEGVPSGCTQDGECGIDQICIRDTNACEDTCIDDLDCPFDETCVMRPDGGQGKVCRFTAPRPDCTQNSECTAQPDGVCFNGECEYPSNMDSFRWVLILDESRGDAACDQTDPGSDIMGVRLLDDSGTLLGWGDAGNASLGESGTRANRYDTTVRLDGTSHGFENMSCPAPGSRLSQLMPPPLSLGCGGWVLIQFFDAAGQPLDITDGSRIEVLEYGSTCGGSSDDAYSVLLCTDTQGALGGDDTSCTNAIGGVQEGFSSIQVTL